jgi:hypothetical protein
MTEDPRLWAFVGAVIGATASAAMNYFIFRLNRAQNYYSGLAKMISDHNWSLVKEDVDDGLVITGVDRKVAIVCYQHLNILFYAWLHRHTIETDGSMKGWRNWATAIVNGAKTPDHKQHCIAYFQILCHGDLYPAAFLQWLESTLGLSKDAFSLNESGRVDHTSPESKVGA